MSAKGVPRRFVDRSTCSHNWLPVSFVFETGGFQPDTETGRVYCVCVECASHSYVTTKFIGYYLGGSDREGLEE